MKKFCLIKTFFLWVSSFVVQPKEEEEEDSMIWREFVRHLLNAWHFKKQFSIFQNNLKLVLKDKFFKMELFYQVILICSSLVKLDLEVAVKVVRAMHSL